MEDPVEVHTINLADIVCDTQVHAQNVSSQSHAVEPQPTLLLEPSIPISNQIVLPPGTKVLPSASNCGGSNVTRTVILVREYGSLEEVAEHSENEPSDIEIMESADIVDNVLQSAGEHQQVPAVSNVELDSLCMRLSESKANGGFFLPSLLPRLQGKFFPVYDTCGFCHSLDDATDAVSEFQSLTGSKFVIATAPICFGKPLDFVTEVKRAKRASGMPRILFTDPSSNKRKKNQQQFSCRMQEEGVPFVLLGSRLLRCHRSGYGSSSLRRRAERRDFTKRREIAAESMKGFALKPSQRCRKMRQSKKDIDCQAAIVQRDVVVFPQFAIDVSEYPPHKRSATNNFAYRKECQTCRDQIYKYMSEGGQGERRIYMEFARPSEHNHPMFEDEVPTRKPRGGGRQVGGEGRGVSDLGPRLLNDCNELYAELDSSLTNMRLQTQQVTDAIVLARVKTRLAQTLDLLKSDLPEVEPARPEVEGGDGWFRVTVPGLTLTASNDPAGT